MNQPTSEELQLINDLKESINQNNDLQQERKESALKCVEDIEKDIRSGRKVEKDKWDDLLNNTADSTSPTTLAIKLAEKHGYLPSL